MKKTQIDKAIEQLEGEKRVLELAIAKLREAQAAKPARARKARVVAMPAAEAAR